MIRRRSSLKNKSNMVRSSSPTKILKRNQSTRMARIFKKNSNFINTNLLEAKLKSNLAKYGLQQAEDECYFPLIETTEVLVKDLIEQSIDKFRIRKFGCPDTQPNFNQSLAGDIQKLNLHQYTLS